MLQEAAFHLAGSAHRFDASLRLIEDDTATRICRLLEALRGVRNVFRSGDIRALELEAIRADGRFLARPH